MQRSPRLADEVNQQPKRCQGYLVDTPQCHLAQVLLCEPREALVGLGFGKAVRSQTLRSQNRQMICPLPQITPDKTDKHHVVRFLTSQIAS